jgi:hypothetical protein
MFRDKEKRPKGAFFWANQKKFLVPNYNASVVASWKTFASWKIVWLPFFFS